MEKEEVSKIRPGDKVYVEYTVGMVDVKEGRISGIKEGMDGEGVPIMAEDVARWERGMFRRGDIVRYTTDFGLVREGIVEEHKDYCVGIRYIFIDGRGVLSTFCDYVNPNRVILLIPWEEWRNLPEWDENKKGGER